MKETGIIMSGDHPAKILDGLKTMTRRTYGLEEVNKDPDNWFPGVLRVDGAWSFLSKDLKTEKVIKCPYGQVGDLLWVKETWAGQDFAICDEDYSPVYIGKDGLYHPVIHKAGKENYAWGLSGEPKWRTSRFMQKIATRIWREITGLRAERLQEITEEDAIAEGFYSDAIIVDTPIGKDYTSLYARDRFVSLWDSLNAKRGYGWDFNPWVWPISFKEVKDK